ncbi:MAG: sensor histidine kinase [Pirellula sp.]
MSPDPQHPSPTSDHPSAPSLGHLAVGNPPDREAWIAQLEQRLVQCERLASIGELSSTTTHEFNNILMTILNYAKLGLRHKDDATRDKALSRILDAANRGAKITSTVLGLSRARATPPEPTNLVTLVDDTLVLLERELMKYRIDVVKEFSPTPEILASTNQLQRLLLNLITNARQAIGENGTILIRIAHEPKSNAVVFTVRDNGKGIPAEVLPRIFEPFFTTKQGPDATGKGGTGLGLSACKEIVDEHRGRIRVESTVGKGTSFTIRFPAIQPSAASGPTAQAS